MTLTARDARTLADTELDYVERRLQVDINDGGRPDQWSMEDMVRHVQKARALIAHLSAEPSGAERAEPLPPAVAFSDRVVKTRDGDKANNHADNLEWCTAAENRSHASKVLYIGTRAVVGTNIKDGSQVTFKSLSDAETEGFKRSLIQKCLNGERHHHGGHSWADAPALGVSASAAAQENQR